MTAKFLTADWRYLAMLNFAVDRAVLTPHLPRGTQLDDRDGRQYLSLVAFLFLDTHVLGLPALFHQNFEEVNLRFYVRRRVGGEWRSGVVFIREMVPLFLVAKTAKLTYNEPYRTVPMTAHHPQDQRRDAERRVSVWRRARSVQIRAPRRRTIV